MLILVESAKLDGFVVRLNYLNYLENQRGNGFYSLQPLNPNLLDLGMVTQTSDRATIIP